MIKAYIIAVVLSHVYNTNETNVFRYYYFIDANSKEEFDYYVHCSKENIRLLIYYILHPRSLLSRPTFLFPISTIRF